MKRNLHCYNNTLNQDMERLTFYCYNNTIVVFITSRQRQSWLSKFSGYYKFCFVLLYFRYNRDMDVNNGDWDFIYSEKMYYKQSSPEIPGVTEKNANIIPMIIMATFIFVSFSCFFFVCLFVCFFACLFVWFFFRGRGKCWKLFVFTYFGHNSRTTRYMENLIT